MSDVVEETEALVSEEETVETPAKPEKDTGTAEVNSNGTVDVTFGSNELAELEPGTYRKVTNRVGAAFLTVAVSGDSVSLSYTNRRLENEEITPKRFITEFNRGMNTLHDGSKPEPAPKAPKAAKPAKEDEPTDAEMEAEEIEASEPVEKTEAELELEDILS